MSAGSIFDVRQALTLLAVFDRSEEHNEVAVNMSSYAYMSIGSAGL